MDLYGKDFGVDFEALGLGDRIPFKEFTDVVSGACSGLCTSSESRSSESATCTIELEELLAKVRGVSKGDLKKLLAALCGVVSLLCSSSDTMRPRVIEQISMVLSAEKLEYISSKARLSKRTLTLGPCLPFLPQLTDVSWRLDYKLRCSRQTLQVLDHVVCLRLTTSNEAIEVSCARSLFEELLTKVEDALLQIEECTSPLS